MRARDEKWRESEREKSREENEKGDEDAVFSSLFLSLSPSKVGGLGTQGRVEGGWAPRARDCSCRRCGRAKRIYIYIDIYTRGRTTCCRVDGHGAKRIIMAGSVQAACTSLWAHEGGQRVIDTRFGRV